MGPLRRRGLKRAKSKVCQFFAVKGEKEGDLGEALTYSCRTCRHYFSGRGNDPSTGNSSS
jgi:hypothetical protein